MTNWKKIYLSFFLSIFLIGVFTSCNKNNKTEQMKIVHTQLPTAGLSADLQKGVSAAYAALLDGKLIVAGGCNFPDKPPYEGGAKIYYDEILMIDTLNPQAWSVIGKLPEAAAYGVSVQLDNSALWIGGNGASKSYNDVYRVSLDNDTVVLDTLPQLPAAFDNFAGCAVNNLVFVGGGNESGKASNSVYTIRLDQDSVWTKLPDFPGEPRVQPVMAALEIDGNEYLYLLGGIFGGDADRKPMVATDVLRYSVAGGSWEKVAGQFDPISQRPFSLGGATAMAIENRYILAIGGVNYDIFLDALASIHKNTFDKTISDNERKERAKAFSLNYMTQPIDYYKFNKEYRLFDTETNIWSTLDVSENGARAGATLLPDGRTFYAVQGELKPGVRTPETWKGEIKSLE